MKLNDLLEGLTYKLLRGQNDVEISNVEHHSGRIEPQTLFVAISGYQRDGHDFVEEVVAKGAVAIVVEKEVKVEGLPEVTAVVLVEDTKRALALIANRFYGEPSRQMDVVGITGTNGKTSITQMLNNLYESKGTKNAVFGTIANYIDQEEIPTANTTPDALELARLMHRAVEKGVDKCFMEVSSHALKMERVYGITFKQAVFTNLTEDHLDFHPDFEDYFQSKLKLFKMAEKSVVNIDNDYGLRIVQTVKKMHDKGEGESCPSVVTYGLTSEADLWADKIESNRMGSRFFLNWKGQKYAVRIPIPGKIYIYNLLACIGVMLLDGVEPEVIVEATKTIKPVRGRLETVPNPEERTILVDYSHTPDALENVLKAIRDFSVGKVITVFGCGGDRDKKKRPMMGEIAQRLSDLVVLTSDNPRTEQPEDIIEDVLAGMSPSSELKVEVDRRKAIYLALEMSSKDDVVLIAGKGHENYQIIGKTKIHFDDKEVAQDYFSKGATESIR